LLYLENPYQPQKDKKESFVRQKEIEKILDLTTPFVIPQSSLGTGFVYFPPESNSHEPYDESESLADTKKRKARKSSKKRHYLSGALSLTRPLNPDRSTTIGSSLNLKLTKNWTVNTSGQFAIEDDYLFGYSWGLGYRNRKFHNWALQLNNWGPLRSGDGLLLDDAIASVSYKVPSEILKKNKLASSLSLNKRISSDIPSASASLHWSLTKYIYIRTGVSRPLDSDAEFSWSLSFGHTDWRPNKFRYEYHNFGPEFHTEDGFVDNGILQISYGWVW